MSNYTEYFLRSKSSVVALELLEVYHPNFSKIYYLVRNRVAGVTVTLETGSNVFFQYYPLQIDSKGNYEDLDVGFVFNLGDLGEILPDELDLVSKSNNFKIKPTVKFRLYRSDDLTAPMEGPLLLEISNFAFKKEGCSFTAEAPKINIARTGELYSFARFPMLIGFL